MRSTLLYRYLPLTGLLTLLQWTVQPAPCCPKKTSWNFWNISRNISWNISRLKISWNFTSLDVVELPIQAIEAKIQKFAPGSMCHLVCVDRTVQSLYSIETWWSCRSWIRIISIPIYFATRRSLSTTLCLKKTTLKTTLMLHTVDSTHINRFR